MISKMRNVGFTVAIAVSVLMGCQSVAFKVSTSEDDKKVDEKARYYEISSGDESFIKDNGSSTDGVLYDEDCMPIRIVEGQSDKKAVEANWTALLCICSCFILPTCENGYMTREITVVSPIGKKTGSYRIDKDIWTGLIPIGYCFRADERANYCHNKNDNPLKRIEEKVNPRLQKVGRDRLVKQLVGELYGDYVVFAKRENEDRKVELKRIAASRSKINELVDKNCYDEAAALCEEDSRQRVGSLDDDKYMWEEIKQQILVKKEDYRVAQKKEEVEKKLLESKFDEVVAECEKENDGFERHAALWAELKSKAYREIELIRIGKRKAEISKLFDEKKYAAVIAECDKETGKHAGTRLEDSYIWTAFKTKAQAEQYKIDRPIEEKRIAAKLERVNQLLAEKKFAEVVSLCEEEHGQNVGSVAEDLAQWKSIRLKALVDDLLSKAGERTKDGFCLKGFYLGMSLDEVDVLLDYYFPSLNHSQVRSNSQEGTHVEIAGQVMHFCETSSGRVIRMNFNKKMLEKLLEYDTQTEEEWIGNFAKEYGVDFRSNYVRDSKSKGSATVSVSQACYTYKNTRKQFRVTYFGEKDVTDYNKDPDVILNEAYAKVASYGNDMAYADLAYQIGQNAGYAAQCVKIVRAWLKDEYDNGKGAAEGTLRVESLSD